MPFGTSIPVAPFAPSGFSDDAMLDRSSSVSESGNVTSGSAACGSSRLSIEERSLDFISLILDDILRACETADDLIDELEVVVDRFWVVLLLLLLWPIMFFISAIELCISPSPCLTAAAAVVLLLLDEDVRDDMRCVEEELFSTCFVEVLVEDVDDDSLELLLLLRLLLSSSCDVVIELASDPDVLDASEPPAVEVANRLCRVGSVGEPVSAMSDIFLFGKKNCDRSTEIGVVG